MNTEAVGSLFICRCTHAHAKAKIQSTAETGHAVWSILFKERGEEVAWLGFTVNFAQVGHWLREH